jgi:hypothetical protein
MRSVRQPAAQQQVLGLADAQRRAVVRDLLEVVVLEAFPELLRAVAHRERHRGDRPG